MSDALAMLLDYEAIRQVKARYCHLLDTKDWDGFIALFTPDAIMDVQEDTGNPPISGHAAILEQVRSAVIDAQTAHQVHSSEIDLQGDSADVVTAMQDRVVWAPGTCPIPGAQSITGFGHYTERYVRVDGTWRIAFLKLTRLTVDVHPAPVL
ncbi:MAG: nuclear transport factor 2 family protein [bacterium]|nr:nuclear transport factor 2 family protein [bacterium]